jgi:hypothetical protein
MNRRISALLVLAALVAGCDSDDEEPTTTRAGQPTTSSPSLGGTYERRLTRRHRTHGPPARRVPEGLDNLIAWAGT